MEMLAILSSPLLQQGSDDGSAFIGLICGGIILLVFAAAGASIAKGRGNNQTVGCLLGGFLGLIGLIILSVWPKNQAVLDARQAVSTAPKANERACPYCGETILLVAKVCKHCHRDL